MADALHRIILRELEHMTVYLISEGLADDYVLAFERQTGTGCYSIRHSNSAGALSVLSNVGYDDLYRNQRHARQYNFRMLDGALIQMSYDFDDRGLLFHRLAFLPSPDLLEFQKYPEIYSEEILYADVIDKRAVTVPLRFDFDRRDGIAAELVHPMSHLTLGNYTKCRIPVSAGITPHAFVDFVLRSFYGLASESRGNLLPAPKVRFDGCIAEAERRVIRISVPTFV